MNYFPQNTLTSFKTRLAQPLDLKGYWEVGLAEIQYPFTWFNVNEGDLWAKLTLGGNNLSYNDEAYDPGASADITIKSGYYPTIDKLLEYIWGAKRMISRGDMFKIAHDVLDGRITITIAAGMRVTLSPSLMTLLGFDKTEFTSGKHTGNRMVDVLQGFYSIYLYCPLVEPRMVGDVRVSLLRIIPIKGKPGNIISKEFQPIHYVPLLQRQFQEIEIMLRDDTGKPIPFERGKVVVTLHFRRSSLDPL